MADIRIKDLATTASTTASDDFLAVDGTTNSTRKLSAATPSFATSVTVPGVAGPTATNLTLTGGSTGASLVLGQGANNNITLTPSGSGFVIARSLLSSQRDLVPSSSLVGQVAAVGLTNTNKATVMGYDTTNNFGFIYAGIVGSNYSPIVLQPMAASGNVLIGGTTDIPGSGGLKVFGTTAASSTTTGALQVAGGVGVAGGIYAGADSYFGGAVTIAGGSNTTSAGAVNLTSSSYGGGYTLKDGTKYLGIFSKSSGTQLCFYTNQAAGTDLGSLTPDLIINTGTSTFAGAVTVSSTTAGSAGAGALVVSGGLATGDASYFGGAVTMPSAIVKRASTAADGFTTYVTGGTQYWDVGLQAVGTSNDFRIVNSQSGNRSLSISSSTEAATFAGSVITPAATTAISSVRLPHGTAPTSPVNGDMWTTTAGLYVRINGVTVGPLS